MAVETTESLKVPAGRPAVEPLAMRVPEACRFIGIGRSTLYVLIARGEIEVVKLGCSTLVLTESLRSLIARRRSSDGLPGGDCQ